MLQDALEGTSDLGGGGNGDNAKCPLDNVGPDDLVLDLTDPTSWDHTSYATKAVAPGKKGLYVLRYCGCPSAEEAADRGGAEHTVEFKLRVEFWNEGLEGARDYLSAGSETLPKMFLALFALFFGALVVWAQCMRRHPAQVGSEEKDAVWGGVR